MIVYSKTKWRKLQLLPHDAPLNDCIMRRKREDRQRLLRMAAAELRLDFERLDVMHNWIVVLIRTRDIRRRWFRRDESHDRRKVAALGDTPLVVGIAFPLLGLPGRGFHFLFTGFLRTDAPYRRYAGFVCVHSLSRFASLRDCTALEFAVGTVYLTMSFFNPITQPVLSF